MAPVPIIMRCVSGVMNTITKIIGLFPRFFGTGCNYILHMGTSLIAY